MFDYKVPERFNDGRDARLVHEGLIELAKQRIIRFATTVVLGLVLGGMYGCPNYNVWQKGLAGQAKLAEAEQSRKIAIEEARALKESAEFKSDAEVIRAEGAAKANKIIADGLGGPEGYLRYLFIQAVENRVGDTIYIPTEAGLPILEARSKIK